MDRKSEVRELLKLPAEEVIVRAGERLVVCDDLHVLHRRFAEDIAEEIGQRNAEGLPTRLIVPVGPTGQYPILAEIINERGLSLKDCRLFFMDEYCDEAGNAVGPEHPLSFLREARELFLDRLDPSCGLDARHVVFPNEGNIDSLAGMIEQVGGLDTCYGGIGIHGHVAFNEPAAGIRQAGPRRVELNDFTVTINAVRSGVGGNLECFPRQAFTLGMREILGARRIRLYCRSGCEFDWPNTVLRLALLGEGGDDYPVTWTREHPDCVITADRDAIAQPQHLL